ncbi:hypothetical protein CFP56_011127 [Quercus suber]|uniref:MATH domain-containing protein n=1 Tax=Quercus suber TaxID=58331 RepID=A0AAW0KZ53_QUESU
MNGTNHISLYLSIVDTEKYSLGWEVYATFKLFVFDQIRDKFLTIQGLVVHDLYIYITCSCTILLFL